MNNLLQNEHTSVPGSYSTSSIITPAMRSSSAGTNKSHKSQVPPSECFQV